MYVAIEYVLKTLLENSEEASIDKCEYVGFRSDDDLDWIDGVNAGLMFGRVEYQCNGRTHLWKPMMLKLTPQVIAFPEFHAFAFINEAFFYTRILPFFEKIRPITSLFPKFHTSYIELNANDDKYLLAFENLKTQGYRPSSTRTFLDLDHLKLMLKNLGIFHAYSFEASRRNRDQFYALASSFKEIHFTSLKRLTHLIPSLALRGFEPLKDDPKYASKLENIEKLIPTANELVSEIFSAGVNNPMAVLCHGDFLAGNVLFKYDEYGEPIDAKMIDLASVKIASPVVDLAQVLYINADQNTRKQHWHELIDIYYQSLSETFPGSAPAKELILKEFHTKALHAYFIACYFIPQTLTADLKLDPQTKYLPHEYMGFAYSDIPQEHLISSLTKAGGAEVTVALSAILKDQIDREFI